VENGSDLELVDGLFDPGATTVDGTSSLTRSWTRLYRALAANGDSLPGADFTVVDALGDTVLTGTTGSDGYLDPAALAEWTRIGGATTDFTPYTVHASFGLFDTTVVDTVVSPLGVPVVFTGVGSATGVPDPGPAVTLRLGRNFPNPFRGETRLSFALPARGPVRLEVLDPAGRRVATVLDEEMAEGEYRIPWTAGGDLASGVYFLRLEAAGRALTRKIMILR
jgi:uncharacterized protein YfaS (alpha-2-macroglobulin family)